MLTYLRPIRREDVETQVADLSYAEENGAELRASVDDLEAERDDLQGSV